MQPARGREAARPIVLTAAYYATLVMLGLATAAQGPSLPSLAQHTSSPLDRISLLFVADSFGYLVGSLGGGRLYDRLRGHRLMAGMMLLLCLSSIGVPIVTALWPLLLLAFLLGLGKGAADVGANTLLQWVHGARVGPYMNGLHFCYGAGAVFAPLLLAQIIQATHDIYWVFWTMSIVLAPLAVWLWLLPEPSHRAGAAAQQGEARTPLVPLALMAFTFVFYVGAELGFSNWIYTYALKTSLAGTITAAYLTSAYWATFTVSRLLAVWISTRVRPAAVLIVDFAGSLASLGLIALVPRSAAVLWLGTSGLGLFTASIFPTLLLLAGERLRVTGSTTGWFYVGSGAGSMLLPWLIGKAFASIGPQSMMFILLADTALGLVTLVIFIVWRGQGIAAPLTQSSVARDAAERAPSEEA